MATKASLLTIWVSVSSWITLLTVFMGSSIKFPKHIQKDKLKSAVKSKQFDKLTSLLSEHFWVHFLVIDLGLESPQQCHFLLPLVISILYKLCLLTKLLLFLVTQRWPLFACFCQKSSTSTFHSRVFLLGSQRFDKDRIGSLWFFWFFLPQNFNLFESFFLLVSLLLFILFVLCLSIRVNLQFLLLLRQIRLLNFNCFREFVLKVVDVKVLCHYLQVFTFY